MTEVGTTISTRRRPRSRLSTTSSPATRPARRRRIPTSSSLNGYSNDFPDQAQCKEIALDQITKGSDVVFQVAGRCGLGALDAAKEKSVWGIGVDKDQSFLGDQVMTSAIKRSTWACTRRSSRASTGKFRAAA